MHHKRLECGAIEAYKGGKMELKQVSIKCGRQDVLIETGKIAKQANGAVVVSCGGTVVLVTACMSKRTKESLGFFPLTVEYQEKTYAAGRIPGGFFKREGRPSESEILAARLIDRPIRPLFSKGITNEVQVIAIVSKTLTYLYSKLSCRS